MFARKLTLTLTAIIAAFAFALSFHALTDLAGGHGVPKSIAWMWALVIDLTIIAATVATLVLPRNWYVRGVFISAASTSIGGNTIHALQYGLIGVAVSAVPPIARLGVVGLAIRLSSTRPTTGSDSDRPKWLPRQHDATVDLTAGWRTPPASTDQRHTDDHARTPTGIVPQPA